MNTNQLKTLVSNYNQLTAYCDALFQRVYRTYNNDMKCSKGCAECCRLETVVPLEAFIIEEYLTQNELEIKNNDPGYCVFLHQKSCQIYPVRPIICRTHGLILYDSEEKTIKRSCELNFLNTDFESASYEHMLDELLISKNLIKLNLAFQQITGKQLNGERVFLKNIINW